MSYKITLGLLVLILIIILGFIARSKITGSKKSMAGSKKTVSTQEKLKIEDTKVGKGKGVKSGDTILIHYKGPLTDGTEFDSSYKRGEPFETAIGVERVIEGWDKGIIGMKVGGKRKLTIPSDMGYGDQGAGDSIPPGATLIFEVELVEIQ